MKKLEQYYIHYHSDGVKRFQQEKVDALFDIILQLFTIFSHKQNFRHQFMKMWHALDIIQGNMHIYTPILRKECQAFQHFYEIVEYFHSTNFKETQETVME